MRAACQFLLLTIVLLTCCFTASAQSTRADAGQNPDDIAPVVLNGAAQDSDRSAANETNRRPWLLLLVYCTAIVAASMFGGALPFLIQLTHTRMQTMISFVGGLMLGIGIFHLLPHSVHELGSAKAASQWMMVGIVMMFVLLRLFHFHNHEPVAIQNSKQPATCGHDHDHDHDTGPDHTGHGHSPEQCHTHSHSHGLSWFGIAFGLSLHTLIDGLALAASVQSQARQPDKTWLYGAATFLAVLLHKPLDAVSITSLMAAGGWKKRTMQMVNAGFAMMCPLGVMFFLLGLQQFAGYQREIIGTALAFSAGVFVCISLSDLLPEMEFHSHNKVQLTVALGLGITLSWLLTFLDAAHMH